MGKRLFEESHVDADMVIPVPDSGVPAAIGYAETSRIPFELGIIRNHYIGRTFFIQPSQSIRSFGVKIKLNPQTEILKGKKIVVGMTPWCEVQPVKNNSIGATSWCQEVHFRIASPPTTGSCYYGVDTPKKEQLIANEKQ